MITDNAKIADVIEASGEVFTLGAVEAVRAPVLELVPINYLGFVRRIAPVTQAELEEAPRLFLLAEQQRRVGVRA